jgi:hypothetical protein
MAGLSKVKGSGLATGAATASLVGIDDNATSTKLTVADTGIDVTGTVTADGLTSDGATNYPIKWTGAGGAATGSLYGDGSSVGLFYGDSSFATGLNFTTDTLKFRTGSSERLRIDSDGLKFNGDTAAASALDDYEEGTWTPTIVSYSGTNPTITGTMIGTYTKIGNRVILSFYGSGVNASGTTSNILKFTGVPFAINDSKSAGSWITHKVNYARPVIGALTNIADGIGYLSSNDGGVWDWENVNMLGTDVSFRASYSYLTNS